MSPIATLRSKSQQPTLDCTDSPELILQEKAIHVISISVSERKHYKGTELICCLSTAAVPTLPIKGVSGGPDLVLS